ncbi:MAG: hypothetical protein ACHQ49_04230 [Elusimicrobiota bacterium]
MAARSAALAGEGAVDVEGWTLKLASARASPAAAHARSAAISV